MNGRHEKQAAFGTHTITKWNKVLSNGKKWKKIDHLMHLANGKWL